MWWNQLFGSRTTLHNSTLFLQHPVCRLQTGRGKIEVVWADVYWACMVLWSVFTSIEASFLPVGQMYADEAQCISITFQRLRSNNTVAQVDL